MKIINYIFFYLVFSFHWSTAQLLPRVITQLPDTIKEASGIEFNSFNSIWIHNDSGDSSNLYQIDTLGNLLRTIRLVNHIAIDIEDVTQDANGSYYVADVGNNFSDRTNLQILKIKNPDLVSSDTVTPQIISYTYSDQFQFPPDSNRLDFDCEALFHFNDSLWLFSKNHGTSPYTRLYKLPDTPGNYIAILVDSFNTGERITAADISPDRKSVVLLSDTVVWLFSDFHLNRFFNGTAQKLFYTYSQKEGVVFTNDTTVLIVDEKEIASLNGKQLYTLNLSPWITKANHPKSKEISIEIFPNPSSNGSIIINYYSLFIQQVQLRVVNTSGQIVFEKMIELNAGKNQYPLVSEKFVPGTYFISIKNGNSVTTLTHIQY